MADVIPAIIPNNLEEIKSKILLVKGLVEKVQLDFVDGKYVPPITWPFNLKEKPKEKFTAAYSPARTMTPASSVLEQFEKRR